MPAAPEGRRRPLHTGQPSRLVRKPSGSGFDLARLLSRRDQMPPHMRPVYVASIKGYLHLAQVAQVREMTKGT